VTGDHINMAVKRNPYQGIGDAGASGGKNGAMGGRDGSARVAGWMLQDAAMTYTVTEIGGDRAVHARLVGLNNESAQETSRLDVATFDSMIAAAPVATCIAPDLAFLLGFAESSHYEGAHFLWFRQRYPSFLYVDRVVVGQAHRRLGLGRLLYDDLFRRAERLGVPAIACEVNVRPPNPASDAFHAGLGFSQVGIANTADGSKTVRYLLRTRLD
jgi:uncharacterized protein